MILTIDVGNTNTVLGVFDNDEIIAVARISTDKYKMADEYAALMSTVLSFNRINFHDITGAIISSVVPPMLPSLKFALKKLDIKRILTVSPGTKTGLNIKIDDPAVLGADLVCGGVAAIKRYDLPCVIIDLGTATKFSVIDKNGDFLGGTILPGVNISLNALSCSTAQLPHIELNDIDHVIGTNSIDCMKAGIVYGTAAIIDGMLKRIEDELGEKVTAVMTGGISKSILPYCNSELIYDENLLLYGLYEIYLKNTK